MSTKEKEYTYKDFLESEETKAAAAQRKQAEASKPSSFSYGTYTPSDSVKQAQDKLNQHTQNKPGAYTSQWQTSLNDTLNKILNREKFTYDLNGDALYNQYKNQYTTQGVQAMMDTMGQAQAMTGGYGNSYAQTAGQQTYQGYMQQLNDRIPELYQLALNQYNQEGENLYNQYGLFADRENQDYGRYRDQMSDYNTELARLTEDSRYMSEQDYNRYLDNYNMAYGEYRDSVSDWQNAVDRADNNYWNLYNRDYSKYADDVNLQYQQAQDALAQQQWQTQFDYAKEQDALAQQQWQAEFDEAVRQFNFKNGIATGGGVGNTGAEASNTNPYSSNEAVKAAQKFVGTDVDGQWGPKSKAAAQAMGFDSLEAVLAHLGITVDGSQAPVSVEDEVRAKAAYGAERNEIMRYIKAANDAGQISDDEYIRLMSAYASAGM